MADEEQSKTGSQDLIFLSKGSTVSEYPSIEELDSRAVGQCPNTASAVRCSMGGHFFGSTQ